MPYNKEELFKLPAKEKLELVEALWDSLEEEYMIDDSSIKNVEEELDRRSKYIEEFTETLIPWEKVKEKLNQK